MLILNRYITRLFCTYNLWLVMLISVVIGIFEFLEVLRRSLVNPDYTFPIMMKLVALRVSRHDYHLMPYILLSASALLFLQLKARNEWQATQYLGLSTCKLLSNLSWALLALFVIDMTVLDPAMTGVSRRINSINHTLLASPIFFLTSGIWLKENTAQGYRFICTHHVQSNRFADLKILEFDRSGAIIQLISAESASLHHNLWHLQNAWLSDTTARPTAQTQLTKETRFKLSDILDLKRYKDNIPVYKLYSIMQLAKKLGLPTNAYAIIWHKNMMKLLFWISMLLMSFALITTIERPMILYTALLVTGMFVFFCSEIIYALVVSEKISPISLWLLPSGVTLLSVLRIRYAC